MSARQDTWMPFYVGDYLRDTTHLTTEGHGAYLLLLMTSWVRGGSLPNEDHQLAAIARVTPKRWAALKPILQEFFQVADGLWTQKRVKRELEAAKRLSDARRKSGTSGAQSRWQSDSKTMANATASECQNDRPSQSPLPIKEESKNTGLVKGALCARKVKAFDFSNPANRQAFARQKMAAFIDPLVLMAAEDPSASNHAEAVELARAAAKKAEVMWVPPVTSATRKVSA